MFPFPPPQTAEEAGAALTTLTDAAWVLAAVVEIGRLGPRDTYPFDNPPARVLAQAGLLVDGAGGYAPAPGLVALMAQMGPARASAAASVLGQVLAVVRGDSLDNGWAQQDDETLLAQGTASGQLLSTVFARLAARLPGFEARLQRPGAAFLDVGVGVGGLACAAADAFPDLSVVGLDPFDRALALARRQIEARGLESRVSLRACGVEELTDQEAFDVAWLPAPFVPPPAFLAGVANLHRAVRPGGWIVVGMGRLEGSGLSVEVTRWQTTLIGGTPLTPHDAREVLTQAGFGEVTFIDTPAGTPAVVAARRLS